MKKIILILLSLALAAGAACSAALAEADGVKLSDDASDFVLLTDAVPDAILEIRYYSTYNFVGDRIDGYEEPLAFLTKEAAAALRAVSDECVSLGYRLKIYDAYRPQMAVSHFMRWALDYEDTRMKGYFYPELEKDVLFPLGYIAEHSGHSRGSTVDLTLFDMTTEKEADMGGTFDYFGELSHPDYTGITEEQFANRMLLRTLMTKHGFKPLVEEWWHFTLENEPFPDTYFTFPINSGVLENAEAASDGKATRVFPVTAADAAPQAYILRVVDQDGAAVAGLAVNFCTDTACTLLKSDETGTISFAGAPDVYHVQLLKAPEGYSFDPDFEMYTESAYGEWVLCIRKD